MRLSVSTKIFLGFAVVIASFGLASVYSAYRIQNLGDNVRFIRRGALPAQNALRALQSELDAFERALGRRRPSDLKWVRSFLPSLQPFERVASLGEHMQELASRPHLNPRGRRDLENLSRSLAGLAGERTALDGIVDKGSLPLVQELVGGAEAPASDRALYALLGRVFDQLVVESRLDEALEIQTALRSIVRQLDRRLSELARHLDSALDETNEQAEKDEENAILAVVVTTTVALFISLAALLISHFTLAPIRQLREGVRRISEGDYGRRVKVSTRDEIGQLAGEFNKMAESLTERDQMLARQREALLRTERLATIGKMSSQITHEIRNPLVSLGLNVELLEEELASALAGAPGAPEEARGLLRAINREVDRLRDVTDGYLRFGRVAKSDPEPVDLGAVLADTLQFHREDLAKRGVRVESEFNPVPSLELDGQQIRQVLVNLLNNAAEAMPEGGTVRLRTAHEEDSVMVEIRDYGPGIPESDRDKVFDPFYSTKRTGTGLGLAVTLQIVTDHGGSITLDCPDGGGTRVTLRFPVG